MRMTRQTLRGGTRRRFLALLASVAAAATPSRVFAEDRIAAAAAAIGKIIGDREAVAEHPGEVTGLDIERPFTLEALTACHVLSSLSSNRVVRLRSVGQPWRSGGHRGL